MNYEKSCGAVLFTRQNGFPRYVLIQSRQGIYGFPKGHMEAGETEEETALREIFEEVGIKPALLEGFREMTEYPLPGKADTMKQVVCFLAEYEDQPVKIQLEEVASAGLFSYEEAMQLLQFEDLKVIFQRADLFLRHA